MKLLQCLLCNLFINTNKYYKNYPEKCISFKNSKNIFLNNDIYFDIYNDKYQYNSNNLYKKYNELTAEHVFPQSFIKRYPESKFDMHNIYLTSSITNNFRSNYKYVDEKNYIKIINQTKYIVLPKSDLKIYNNLFYYRSNPLNIFIPNHSSRGMIARSIAYMKFTYIELNIDSVIDIYTLKKWNILYPPSFYEKYRNYIIKLSQGNENIFITNYLLINELF
tara:strand:+ start:16979 stop:17641 length:663 start_codon:yes stop_codon:yes gene_type:complete